MTDKPSEKVLSEFISEAQETVENLNRDLLALDAQRDAEAHDPDLLNGAFRAVHSLKGLSGLFGVASMSQMSHTLENLLDSVRLGKVILTPEILDLLFEAIERYGKLIAAAAAGRPVEAEGMDGYLARIERAAQTEPRAPAPRLSDYQIDPNLMSVLTEYEEHRLRENLRLGKTLYRVHAGFELTGIDTGLEELKARLKPLGEVITYLPSPEPSSDDRIDLDVILAAEVPVTAVELAVAGLGVPAEVTRVLDPRGPQGRPAAMSAPLPILAPLPVPASTPPAASGDDKPSDDDRTASLRSVSQTVRVDIRKLDHLMNVVGELALVRAGVAAVLEEMRLHRELTEVTRRLHHESRVLERKLNELQTGILEVRMVPLGQIFDKLSRVVRRISRDGGKQIRLVIHGAETELDKLIVEELSDPLMHVIRNAIDHGIETAEERRKKGKPEVGTVAIAAQQKGNHVVIEVRDDGAGFDEQRILETAIKKRLIDRHQANELSRRELLNLVFLPGFSTRDEATEMSGRGVGMDVVKTNIARLSGLIDLTSVRGEGTAISITLPITLAILHALIIKSAGRTFAVPLNSVLESLTLEPREVQTIEGRHVLTLRGQTLLLARVDAVLGLGRNEPPPERSYVVVVGVAQHRLGFIVDELVGQQDVVIKSLGRALADVPGIAGATELGGQQIVLVLDVAALVEEALRGAAEAA